MHHLETNITNIYGDRGRSWLADLPAKMARATETYHLSDLKPLAGLTYHYVMSGFQRQLPVIVKLGIDEEALHREAAALKAFSGFGTVSLLVESGGLLLLEQAIPGTSLKSYFPFQDEEAMEIACSVMKRLHQAPLPQGIFPHVREWLAALDGEWKIPSLYLEKARALKGRLLAESVETILLHGDLHHDNILRHGGEWRVIDPKGVLGEPIYEVAAFIRNPFDELSAADDAARIMARRIKYFAKAWGFDRERIQDWCFVQAVLAWAWALEDGGDIAHFARLVKILDGLAASFD